LPRLDLPGLDLPGLDLMATIGWLTALGVPGFVVTAVDRVGRMSGPDADLVRRVARSGRPTLAAGGIRSIEDLQRVRSAGAVGAIVGTAALAGGLDLASALSWARV
jgi:phosphoribosylformimino-5-aminoimidazole carboxamide ribonucleotide (ProFAR) isomerase